jgi:2-keto-3-deoxygluconate permease
MLPFSGLALGATINLTDNGHAGLLGIPVGLFTLVLTGAILFVANRLTGRDDVARVAVASSVGNTVAVPAIVSAANPRTRPLPPWPPCLSPPASWGPPSVPTSSPSGGRPA